MSEKITWSDIGINQSVSNQINILSSTTRLSLCCKWIYSNWKLRYYMIFRESSLLLSSCKRSCFLPDSCISQWPKNTFPQCARDKSQHVSLSCSHMEVLKESKYYLLQLCERNFKLYVFSGLPIELVFTLEFSLYFVVRRINLTSFVDSRIKFPATRRIRYRHTGIKMLYNQISCISYKQCQYVNKRKGQLREA